MIHLVFPRLQSSACDVPLQREYRSCPGPKLPARLAGWPAARRSMLSLSLPPR